MVFNYFIYEVGGLWCVSLYTTDKKLVKRKAFKTYRECLEMVQLLQLHIRESDKTLKLKVGA